jgi:hypothetical protein
LVGTPNVLRSIYVFQDEISMSNTHRNQARHDELLTAMMKAMQDDVSPGPCRGREPLNFRLIAPPPSEDSLRMPGNQSGT